VKDVQKQGFESVIKDKKLELILERLDLKQ